MIRSSLICFLLAFIFISCNNKSSQTPQIQTEDDPYKSIGEEKNAADSFKVIMKVNSYSIHFAVDSICNKHEYKSKIKLFGHKTDSCSNFPFTQAEFWYEETDRDKICFNEKEGKLSACFQKEEMKLMIQLLESDYNFRISYSMDTEKKEHIIVSTVLKEH